MYLIVGLGNPGLKYAKTKHNMGFMVVDILADKYNIEVDKKKSQAYVGQGLLEGHKSMLVKPQTFMNLSGESVMSLVNYYDIDPEEELIVIYDDISLEPGSIRVRKKGSAGGHNGMKNIIKLVGTENFTRIRVGIGAKPEKMDLADYVLAPFEKSVIADVEDGLDQAARAVTVILTEGVDEAMNQFNKKAKAKD